MIKDISHLWERLQTRYKRNSFLHYFKLEWSSWAITIWVVEEALLLLLLLLSHFSRVRLGATP